MREIRVTVLSEGSDKTARRGAWQMLLCSMVSFFIGAGALFLLFVRATGMELQIQTAAPLALFLTFFLRLLFWKKTVSRIVFPAGLLLAGGFCWYRRETLLSGLFQTADSVIGRINKYYGTNYPKLSAGEDLEAVELFFQTAAVLLFFVLAFEMYHRGKTGLLLILSVLLTAGALAVDIRPEPVSLFGAAFGILMGRGMECRKGRRAFPAVQARAGLLMGLAAAFAIGFAYFAAGPALYPEFVRKFEPVKAFQSNAEQYMEQKVTELASREGGFSIFSLPQAQGGVVSGKLSNTFGGNSDREAMRVVIDADPDSLSGMIYLRGFTGNRYLGDSWEAVSAEDFEEAADGWRFYSGDKERAIANAPYQNVRDYRLALDDPKPEVHYTIEVTSSGDKYAYLPYQARAEEGLSFKGDGDILLGDQRTREYSGYVDVVGRGNYGMQSRVIEMLLEEYGAYVREEYTQVPEGMYRLRGLAEELSGGRGVSLDGATARIREYLQENCRYSLELDGLPEGEDFTEYFLFEQKEGFCTHFASSALLLYRLMGHPARYVTGYVAKPDSFREKDGAYEAVVTGQSAHAWVEVFEDGYGWKPVEMTPGYTGESAASEETSGEEAEEPKSAEPTPEAELTSTPEPAPEEEAAAEADAAVFDAGEENKSAPAFSPGLIKGLTACADALLFIAAVCGALLLRRMVKYRGFLRKIGCSDRKRAVIGMARRCWEEWEYLTRGGAEALDDGAFADAFAKEYPQLGELCKSLMDAAQRAYFGDEEITPEEYRGLYFGFRKLEREMYRGLDKKRRLLWLYGRCFGK